jgi:AraC family transcriptional regulator
MQNRGSCLVYLRPTPVIYVRQTGPYERTIPQAWDRLFKWLGDNGLYSSLGRGYGLARDNPADVGPQHCRYDACVEFRSELEDRALRELAIATLPGGAYACQRHSGSYDRMRSLVANIYSEFEPDTGLDFDASRPVVSIYVDNPDRYSESELRAEICVPVVVKATPAQSPARAAV